MSNIINIDDYRPKTQERIKSEHCVKSADDYANNLRNYGYPEIKVAYMRNDFLWKLAENIKSQD